MKALMFAIVPRIAGTGTRHFKGMPPMSPGEPDARMPMRPAALVVAAVADEGFFLYRFDEYGEVAGDTWHVTLEELKEQAVVEYAVPSTGWTPIPADSSELLPALRYAKEHLPAD